MFTSLKCKLISRKLCEWEDGELLSVQLDRVKTHLAGCSKCREAASEFQAMSQMMGAFAESGTDDDPNDWYALRSRLTALPQRSAAGGTVERTRVLSTTRWRRALVWSGAAAACAAVVIPILIHHKRPLRETAFRPEQPLPATQNQVASSSGDKHMPAKGTLQTPRKAVLSS